MRMRVAMRVIASVPGADRSSRGEDQATGLDPLGADQSIGKLSDELGCPPEQDHFETARGIEVDVRGRDDAGQVQMLKLGELLGNPAGVMVVDQRDDTH